MIISKEYRHELAEKLLKDKGLTEFNKQMEKDHDYMICQAAWMRKCVKPFKPFNKVPNLLPRMATVTDGELLMQCIKTMGRHGKCSEQYKDARRTMMALFRKAEQKGGVN